MVHHDPQYDASLLHWVEILLNDLHNFIDVYIFLNYFVILYFRRSRIILAVLDFDRYH